MHLKFILTTLLTSYVSLLLQLQSIYASSSASISMSSIATTNNNDNGIISFPLLSHQHVIDRRRRELQATFTSDEQDINEFNNLIIEDRITNTRNNNNNNNLRHLSAKKQQHAQQQLGALYQGYGTHYIDIWVGYPNPQRQTAIVDTGSSATAFPCSQCMNCGHHTDMPFDEGTSQSFRRTKCTASSGNDDGCIFGKCDHGLCMIEHNFGIPNSPDSSSWIAYEAQDVAYAGGPHDRPIATTQPDIDSNENIEDELNPIHATDFSFPLTFGCQTSVSGYFEKQLASGIMGLDKRAHSFWGQMRSSNTIHQAQFSLCFVKQPIASISGSTAGSVTLGGVDKRLHKSPMVFANSVSQGSSASFKVQLRKMYLREGNDLSVMFNTKHKYHVLDITQVELNGNEKYDIDSGTTDTYFIKSLSDEFRKVWMEITGREYSNEPISVGNDSDLLKFPTIVLQLVPHVGGVGDEVQTDDPRTVPGLAGNVDMSTPNDVLIAIPPKHYMQRNAQLNTYTSRIYLDRDDALGNVLGANSMMGHDILFDLDNSRIGFAESECDYARLVAESAKGTLGDNVEGSGESSSNVVLPASDDSSYKLCESQRCRGFFGLTVAILSVGFFFFARRYVNKKESSSSEYEMQSSSSRNLHSSGSLNGSYREGGYRDKPSSSRRSGSRESDRGSRSDRRSSREIAERRSLSREGSHRSMQASVNSNKSHSSGSSGGSGSSRETRHSSRSHRSSNSHRSRDSHRSNRSGAAGHQQSRRDSSSGSRERRGSTRSNSSRERSSSRQYRNEDYDELPSHSVV